MISHPDVQRRITADGTPTAAVQDLDFSRDEITVSDGKGGKDLAEGWGRVHMPDAPDRKYPNASTDWRWQWVFPQENRWKKHEDRRRRAPPTYSKPFMTFGPSKSSWATKTSALP